MTATLALIAAVALGQDGGAAVKLGAGEGLIEGQIKFETKSLFGTNEVRDAKGKLHVDHEGGTAVFDLGPDAAKWAERIRSPKSRIDKLGVEAVLAEIKAKAKAK